MQPRAPKLLNLRELKLESLPASLDQLLTKDAFKLPERKQEAKDVPSILLPDGYPIPRADFTSLYGQQSPIWGYKKNESKGGVEVNEEIYQQQFNLLIDAIKTWGGELNPLTNQPQINAVRLSNLDTCKENFFNPNYSGNQTPHYFISVKGNLEKIWYILTKSKTLPLKEKIAELYSLCEKIGFCNTGVYTHICDAAIQLTKDSSLDFILAQMRKNITDAYSRAYRDLNRDRISSGSEVHISTALYAYSENVGWGPLVDISKIIEQYGERFTLVDATVLTNFHEYFESSYTPQAILDCVYTHFTSEFNNQKNLLAIKEDKDGWTPYNQEFYDQTVLLANSIQCEWEDVFERSDDYMQTKFDPSLFRSKFLKLCVEKEKLFQPGQWSKKIFAEDYTIYCFPTLQPWIETPEKRVLDERNIPKSSIRVALFVSLTCFENALTNYPNSKKLIQTGDDLINLLSNTGSLSSFILKYLGSAHLRTLIQTDPGFFNSLNTLPANSRQIIINMFDNEFLFDAARYGNVIALKRLILDAKLSYEAEEKDGSTLAHIAAKAGHENIIHALAEYKKFDFNKKDLKEARPLFYAIEMRHLNIIKALHHCGADFYLTIAVDNDKNFLTATNLVGKKDDIEILTLLANYAKDPNSGINLFSAVQSAARFGQVETIKFLADKVDLNQRDFFSDESIAHLVVKFNPPNAPAVIKELAQQNVNLNWKKPPHLKTPFEIAIQQKKWNIAAELLKYIPAFALIADSLLSEDLTIIEGLGEAKADLNMADSSGQTLVHVAALNNITEAISILAKYNVNLNNENAKGITPAHIAAYYNHHEVVKKLAKFNIDFARPNSQGESPVTIAMTHKHWSMAGAMLGINTSWNSNITVLMVSADLLALALNQNNLQAAAQIANHIDLNGESHLRDCTLFKTASSIKPTDNLDLLQIIFQSKINQNLSNHSKMAIARHAVNYGDTHIIKLLQQHKIDFIQEGKLNDSALTHAVRKKSWGIVSAILNINPPTPEEGCLSLPHLLVVREDIAGFKKLLEHKIELDFLDEKGNSPAHYAVLSKNRIMVETLKNLQIDFTKHSGAGILPLTLALEYEDSDIAATILDLHPLSPDEKELHPMHIAVMRGNHHAVCLLKKETTFYFDSDGNSSLHLAVLFDQTELIKNMSFGINDITMKNSSGESPLSLAIGKKRWDIVSLLFALEPQQTETSLVHSLVTLGNTKAISMLAEYKVNFDTPNKFDMLPIHHAADLGKANVVETLIKVGANLHLLNTRKWSVIDFAVSSGDLNVIKLLAEYGMDFTLINNNFEVSHLQVAALMKRWDILAAMLKIDREKPYLPLAHCAVRSGDTVNLVTLNNLGINLNEVDDRGRSPIDYAITHGQTDTLQTLLRLKAATKTPLYYTELASRHEQASIVCIFAKQGVNFECVLKNSLFAVNVLSQLPDDAKLNRETLQQANQKRTLLTTTFIQTVKECKDQTIQQNMLWSVINGENILGKILNTPTHLTGFKFSLKKFREQTVTGSIYRIVNEFKTLLDEKPQLAPEKKSVL